MVAQWLATGSLNPSKQSGGTSVSLGHQGLTATKRWLVPAHDPAESGLERGDASPEFMAMKGQAGF